MQNQLISATCISSKGLTIHSCIGSRDAHNENEWPCTVHKKGCLERQLLRCHRKECKNMSYAMARQEFLIPLPGVNSSDSTGHEQLGSRARARSKHATICAVQAIQTRVALPQCICARAQISERYDPWQSKQAPFGRR